MTITGKSISLAFAAGCFGGLAKALAAWFCGAIGLTALLGSQFAPALTAPWIYAHVVWGGIWALLFLLPIRGWSVYSLGILYSLPQSLISLVFMFPQMNRGLLGLKLGMLTPVLVLLFGFVWGLASAYWWKLAKKSA